MVESDEEQLEVLKKWWDENGTSLIITIVLAVGGVVGYRAWENSIQETGEAASALYEDLVQATSGIAPGSEDAAMVATAHTLGEDLKTKHEGTTYAVFAAMHLAKIAADQGDLETARAELEWALEANDNAHLETLIRTRLARVLVGLADPTAAMALLVNYTPGEGQVASFEEARGDVYHALGDMENARQAYQRALGNLGEGVSKPVLELKLADIPVGDSAVVSEASPAPAASEGDA